jgi:hypothetical protein
MKHFISLGTHFIGYRNTVEDLKGKHSYRYDASVLSILQFLI